MNLATGETEELNRDDGKNPAAVARGRFDGKKGRAVRASKFSPKRPKEIARRAAKSRWKAAARSE